MADFFQDKDQEPSEPQEEKQAEKITIGEEEFDPEELQEIVSKGKFAREVEEKYNTKLDKVWPEYTRTTQELKELREKQKEWEAKQEEPPAELPNEQDVAAQAKAQARRLGLVTVDEIDDYVTKRVTSMQQASELLNNCRNLEGEYKGEDGRPKFDTQEVLTHMQETGIRDPLKAYKDKYETELDEWKEKQFAAARKTGIYTETGSGGKKEPPVVKLTKDNLEESLHDVLHPQNED